MGQEVVVERAVEVGAFLERLREDFPCECPVLPIALHKADLPLSPPALPVRSVMQEQTDGSRLLPGRLDADYMLLKSGRGGF